MPMITGAVLLAPSIGHPGRGLRAVAGRRRRDSPGRRGRDSPGRLWTAAVAWEGGKDPVRQGHFNSVARAPKVPAADGLRWCRAAGQRDFGDGVR